MSAIDELAYARPPMTGEVINLAVSGTAIRFIIPARYAGQPCLFQATGAACDVVFGGSTVDCVYAQASGLAAEAITPHAASGGHIPAGEIRRWIMPLPDQAGFGSAEASGAGFLEITLAYA